MHMNRRLLVCGNLASCGMHGAAFAIGVNRNQAWARVAGVLERIAWGDTSYPGANCVTVKDLGQSAFDGSQRLSHNSFSPLRTQPNMILELETRYECFEDYLAKLRAKYRKQHKRTIRGIDGSGLRAGPLTDIATHSATLHHLYCAVLNKTPLSLAAPREGYFSALADVFGKSCICSTVSDAGKILGFIITVKDGEDANGCYLGLDYGANARHPVYLRLLQLHIDNAIKLGCRRALFGRTALQPKASLGARPVDTYVWVRHRYPLVSSIAARLWEKFAYKEAPERRVFKVNV